MSCAPVGDGTVHNVYLPAGITVVPNARSLSVVNTVAALAPVRQTWFHGTTLPKMTRPRLSGRLYATEMFAPPTAPRTVSGGDICPIAPPRDASTAAQLFTSASTSRLGTAWAMVLIVVGVASTPRILPRRSTRATSIQPGKKVL